MANLPERGAISDNSLEIIEEGGVVIEKGKIIEVGDFLLLRKKISLLEKLISLAYYFQDLLTHILMSVITETDLMSMQKEIQEFHINKY